MKRENRSTHYPNMDIVRYVLSLAVIFAHIGFLTRSRIPFPLSSYDAVGGFFALSGFLMYGSYVKHRDFRRYTAQRARRILPPYAFIVALCAALLVFVSDVPPKQYYLSSGFWEYLAANLTFANWLHPGLPGVFQGTEFVDSAVNGSLWTMKVEWCLYFSVPLFVFLLTLGARRGRKGIGKEALALTVVAASVGYRLMFQYLWERTGSGMYEILGRQIFGQLSYFYCGMCIWFRREWFSRHVLWMLPAGLAVYAVSCSGVYMSILLSPIGLSVSVMSVCMLPKDIRWLRCSRNVSYEMYLFHWPIIQVAVLLDIPAYGTPALCLWVLGATILLSLLFSVADTYRKRLSRPTP